MNSKRFSILWCIGIAMAFGALMLVLPPAVRAATLVVTNANDSGLGSLRQVIADAAPGDTIVFDGDYAIYLTSTLAIDKQLTIDGSGHVINVSGDTGNDGSPNVRVFSINASSSVTLSHLNIVSGADVLGGGIYNSHGSRLTVQNSTLSGNSASSRGGGIYNSGTLTVQNSIFVSNSASYSGGGIHNGSYDTLAVQNSTFSNNSAFDGGGIYNDSNATLTMIHSTLSGNWATHRGGGVYNFYLGTLTMRNSLIGDNGASAGSTDCDGTLTSQDYNLIENTFGCQIGGVKTHDITGQDPRLGALTDNGGGTWTQALLPGSPVLDYMPYGTNGCGTMYVQDQRGFPRPYPANGACDVGAYEIGPLRVAKSATPATDVPYHSLVTYTLVLSNIGAAQDSSVWLTETLPAQVDLDSWVISPTNTTLDGAEIRWHDALGAGQAVTFTFRARHRGDYGDHVVNLTRLSGMSDIGSGAASFDVECTPHFTVQNTDDSGAGSLRQALRGVCSNGVVDFALAWPATITLTSGQLVVGKALTIAGPGLSQLAVSGNHVATVFVISRGVTATIQSLTIRDGHTPNGGGGIFNGYGTLTVKNSDLSGNSTSSGGGGILNGPATLTVQNSTFADNSASGSGGGINNFGMLEVTNSTFFGNSASGSGGGIYNNSSMLTVTNSTISGNSATSGGGIYNSSSVLAVRNSLVGNNNASAGSDCYGSLTSRDYNLIENTAGCTINGITTHNITGQDPQVGPLADNGGGTWTQALLPGSPAIDAALNANCPATDQRGRARDDLQCDIGAYELRYADSPTVFRSVSGAVATTFGPALIGLQRDPGQTDPGVITVTKSLTWRAKSANTIDAYWLITPTITSGFNLTLTLCYTAAESAGLNLDALRFWRFSANQWNAIAGDPITSVVGINYCATITDVNQLSAWTLATDTPTAVILRDFGAASTRSASEVTWTWIIVTLAGLLGMRVAWDNRRAWHK